MPVAAATERGWVSVSTRIEDRDPGSGLRIAAGHLDVRLFLRNQRERLAFAARPSRGWDGDQRKHRPTGLPNAPVILHPAAVGDEEIAALGRVHAAPPAQSDEDVGSVRPGLLLRIRRQRLPSGLSITRSKTDAARPDAASESSAGGVPGTHHPGVGYHQHSGAAQFANDRAQTIDRPRSENDPRPRLKVELDRFREVILDGCL